MLAIHRQHPIKYSEVKDSLGLLVRFHHHMSGTLPRGDARDREKQLRNYYQKEFDSLRHIK
jgi:hypothetical protein